MIRGIQQSGYLNQRHELPKMVPIAPATRYVSMETDTKGYNYKSCSGTQAVSIARRNARERNRVKQVNDGFNELRKKLPSSVIAALSGGARRGSGKKLSKVDTLRMVVEYIRYLQNVIEESDVSMGITNTRVGDMQSYEDEGVFDGSSPYSDSVPSPVSSDCSSGYSSNGNTYISHPVSEQMTIGEEDDLLDTISWWQHK